MTDKVLRNCDRAIELIEELTTSVVQKKHLRNSIHKLDDDYQQKKLGFMDYRRRMEALLEGRSRKEWSRLYDDYMLELTRKVGFFNQQVFYQMICDNPFGSRLSLKEGMQQMAEMQPPSAIVHRKELKQRIAQRKVIKPQKEVIKENEDAMAAEKLLLAKKKRLVAEKIKPLEQEKSETKEEKVVKEEMKKETKEIDAESFEDLFKQMEAEEDV